jgi:hypothetical protein
VFLSLAAGVRAFLSIDYYTIITIPFNSLSIQCTLLISSTRPSPHHQALDRQF